MNDTNELIQLSKQIEDIYKQLTPLYNRQQILLQKLKAGKLNV